MSKQLRPVEDRLAAGKFGPGSVRLHKGLSSRGHFTGAFVWGRGEGSGACVATGRVGRRTKLIW